MAEDKQIKNNAEEKTPSNVRTFDVVLERFNRLAGSYAGMEASDLAGAFMRAGYSYTNLPSVQNARVKAINPLPCDYTKDDLGEFLRNPQSSEIELQQISQILRWTAYPYQKVVKSYSDMLTYRHYVKPRFIDGEKSTAKEFMREWQLVDEIEKAFNIEPFGHEVAAQALTNGKVYYILRSSIDKVHNSVNTVFAQQLPQAWCKIIGFNNISKYTVSFDLMYFMQPGTDYTQFGDLFEPYMYDFMSIFEANKPQKGLGTKYIYASHNSSYSTEIKVGGRNYYCDVTRINADGEGNPRMFQQNGRWCYYVSLPIDRAWTFEIDDSTPIVASPLSGLLQTFANQADYEAAQLSLITLPLIKIFTGEIPYNNNEDAKPEDNYKLSLGGRKLFEAYWNMLMRMTHTGGTAFYTAPVENIKSHDFSEAAGANDVSSSFLEYGMGKTGLQALIPTTSSPHAGIEEYSAKLESRYPDRIYRTLERMFNHFVKSLNLRYKWEITLFGSVYLDDLIRANALKQLDKGDLSQHFILAALDGVTVLDRLSMSYAIKGAGMLELLIPPATSYTMSGSTVPKSDTGGAPTKTEVEVKETEQEKSISMSDDKDIA